MSRLAGLVLLVLLTGCHERKKEAPVASERVRMRAEQAQKNLAEAQTGLTAETRVAPAPESTLKSKVLETDSRGCTWIESEGLVTVGEDETRHQVRAAAINEARRVAMQDFLGVHVRSRFMDFEQEGLKDEQRLTESLLQTTRQGRILDESVTLESYRNAGDCVGCRFGVTLKTCIQPNPPGGDKDFIVELGLSRQRLVSGDEVKLTITTTRDAYLYVYDLWLDREKADLIVPNANVPEVFVKAGVTFEYPDEAARKAGVSKLEAALPDGYKVSAETLRVVASRVRLPEKITEPSQGYLAVLRRMNAAKIEWAEDAQAFTIYRK